MGNTWRYTAKSVSNIRDSGTLHCCVGNGRAVLWLVVLACTFPAPQLALAGTLGVGSVSARPGERIARLTPLADYLAAKLGATDVVRGHVVVADSVFEMAKLIEQGAVDVYFGDPLSAAAVEHLVPLGTQLACSPQTTQSVLFVRKNGGAAELELLRGKIVAFETPVSGFGYLLAKFALSTKGARLQRRDAASDPVDTGMVGYVFSGDDENTAVWVLRGKAPAGAMRSDRYEKLAANRSDALREIYRSESLPAEVAAVRSTLPASGATRLLSALQESDGDPAGRELMRTLTGSTACEPLPAEAVSILKSIEPFLVTELGLP
jgi:phosphonate transport system substrate-binding protein